MPVAVVPSVPIGNADTGVGTAVAEVVALVVAGAGEPDSVAAEPVDSVAESPEHAANSSREAPTAKGSSWRR